MKDDNNYNDRRRRMVQIVCGIMAILMLLGIIVAAVQPMLAYDAETITDTPMLISEMEEEEPVSGLLLRIGLYFGDDALENSFTVSATGGISIGYADTETNEYTEVIKTDSSYVSICHDGNLTYDGDEFILSKTGLVIGGYHLELPTTYNSAIQLEKAVSSVNDKLKAAGLYSSLVYAFPSIRGNRYTVYIGDYGSTASAAKRIEAIAAAVGETPTTTYPLDSVLTIIDQNDKICMEYYSSSAELAVTSSAEDAGLVTPAGNRYAGVFAFSLSENQIMVTNLVELEEYVAGVVPYEINPGWDSEALKAFAIIVRSYALAVRERHPAYHIDLCNGYDCQVYMGMNRQTDAVRTAVAETAGIVISYDGEICLTPFSAVTGGFTVNSEQVWNGAAYSYLRAVETPWEDYDTHTNGIWNVVMSGQQVYTTLTKNGITGLKGAVADIHILELAENSSYIYRVEFVDVYGNTVTIKGTDSVRTALGLKSANFLIAHSGVIQGHQDGGINYATDTGVTEAVISESEGRKTVKVLTADGVKEYDVTDGMKVLEANDNTAVLSSDEYSLSDEAENLVTSSGDNFVFIGRGWGHGCGFSQWGIRSLAKQGKTCEEIISAYLTGITLMSYSSLGIS